MYQIIQHALTLPTDKTKLTLIFSNVSEKDILMKETLDKWASEHKERSVAGEASPFESEQMLTAKECFATA